MNEDNPYEKKPWLRFYDEHVPEHLDYRDISFAQIFREAVEKCAGQVALDYMGTAIRFEELDVLSNKFAHFLQRSGLALGDDAGGTTAFDTTRGRAGGAAGARDAARAGTSEFRERQRRRGPLGQ